MAKDYTIEVVSVEASLVPTANVHSPDPLVPKSDVTTSYMAQNPSSGLYEPTLSRNYTMQVFKTCTDPLYIQYPSNIIFPIVYSSRYTYTPINDYVNATRAEGVYIIESYSLTGVTGEETEALLAHYAKTKGLSYTDEVIADIKDVLDKERVGRQGSLHTILRIVTFVSADIIREEQYTYITGPGYVVTHGVPPVDFMHPFSPKYIKKELLSRDDSVGSATIDITIIDNEHKPYYYMLGNKVRSLRPVEGKCGNVLPNGGSISFKRGDEIIKEYSFKLEELEEYGFYKSREMCITKGDIKLAAEEKKQYVEIEKLKLELQKVEESKKKLQLEASNRERQYELDSRRDNLDMDKKISDLDFHKATKSIDLIHIGTKAKLDVLGKKSDLNFSLLKHAIEIRKLSAELNKAEIMNNLKVTDAVAKTLGSILKLF